MKRVILFVMVAISATILSAQTVNVHFKNGQKIQFSSTNVDFVDFSIKAPDPTVSAGAVVDLGLSVYWCSCNVGAEAPEEYGDYYAWGETKPKKEYTKDNYSYYNSNTGTYTDIGDDISGTAYDAATANLGSDWRMPTKDELNELVTQCTWEWTQINSINGYKVTASNGNSIFIPAAGRYGLAGLMQTGTNIDYLTSSGYNIEDVWFVSGSSSSMPYFSPYYKYQGYPIRPVTNNPNAAGGPVDHSNDYLVTDKISASITSSSIVSLNGKIRSGSVLNVKFTNDSEESVTLTGVEIYDSASSTSGTNLLNDEVEVAAKELKSYSITLGTNMTTPVVRFTYRYNRKKYTVEVTYSTGNNA